MRVLFTFAGGSGHFEPLVPIARSAETAGHIVACGGQPAMIPTIQAAGFTGFATGGDTFGTPTRRPLLALDAEREDRVLRAGFAGRTARDRAAKILALCSDWRADLIVCDEIDFGSMIAAETFGIPYATVLVIAAGSFVRQTVVADPLNRLRAGYGLAPDADLAMLHRYLVLSPGPPSFRDPAYPLPPTAHAIRSAAFEPAGSPPGPPCLGRRGGVPAVYFSLGTVFNVESGDLFGRVLAGLRGLPVDIIATVGREIDPAELGPLPANVRIERYIPQASLLPHCHLVVSHGGSGSVIGALAHGLPMVLLPMGADQPLNAARGETLGVAKVLDALTATPETVGEAVTLVLNGRSYRRAAKRFRDEMAALPGPEHAVMLLERLAVDKRPLVSS